MPDPNDCERYFELLRGHVAAPQEKHLVAAAEMGEELMLAGLPAKDVVDMHQEALERLARECPQMTLADAVCRASEPLTEMFKTYGVGCREREEFERQAELAEVRHQEQRTRDLREIAEHKCMEAKLLHAAEEWRATFDSVTDLISLHDRNFRLVRVNKAFAAALKAHPRDLIGKVCYEVCHGSHEPPEGCPHKRLLETGKPARQERFEPRLRMHFEISTSPMFNQEGHLIGSVHVSRDITERKNAGETLEQQLDELQRSHALTLDREDEAEHLKTEVNELLIRLGEAVRYPGQEAKIS